MAESYKEIEVKCPVCEIVKDIRIPQQIFTQKRFGMIKVQIPYGGVCNEHQFIVFVDIKGKVRGYEKIDLVMKTMKTEVSLTAVDEKINLNSFITNYGLYGTLSIIHAKIFNYPIYILRKKWDEATLTHINRILNNLVPEMYREANQVYFLDEIDYDNNKLKEAKALIMDANQHILQTPWELKLKLKFEEELVQKALEIFDDREQFSIMIQGIQILIKKAEYVKEVLGKVNMIYEEDLINQISQDLMEPKINHYRLFLIKEFIKHRFSDKLADKITSKVEDFLKLL